MADYAIHDTTLTGISNVIRKKEGSSALIDPAEYAERINYMGMLEKKIIVSSPICDFLDGSDDVPTDFVKITIPANFDGVSSVSEKQTGRNLVALNVSPAHSKIDYGVTVNTQTSNTLNITTNGVAYACERLFYSFKKGTYAIKYWATSSDSYTPTISIYRTNGTGVKFSIQPNTVTTFTLSEDTDIDIRIFASGNGDTTIRTVEYTNLQIELGSTVHDYESYIAPTTYSANLGRTVHGAEVDIVNGTGKTKVYKHTFTGDNLSSVSLNYGTAEEGYTHMYFYTNGIPLAYNPSGSNVISDIGVSWSNNASSSPYPSSECYILLNTGSGENQRPTVYAYIHQTWASVEDFKTWLNANPITIVYEVETQTDFTFDGQEIPTRLGYNCFISEQGDTSVAYRASGTIYQYPKGEEASF